MKLEDQVVSLELSRELKENGYPQEGIWWWTRLDKSMEFVLLSTPFALAPRIHEGLVAPTVAELGKVLPKRYFSTRNSKNKWWCSWINKEHGIYNHIEFSDIEADARAKMWLYLEKEGLLKETQ